MFIDRLAFDAAVSYFFLVGKDATAHFSMIHPPDIMNKLLEPSDFKGEVQEQNLIADGFCIRQLCLTVERIADSVRRKTPPGPVPPPLLAREGRHVDGQCRAQGANAAKEEEGAGEGRCAGGRG